MSYETDAKKFAWEEPAPPISPPPRKLMLRVLAAETGLFVRLPTVEDVERACAELGLPRRRHGAANTPDYAQLLRNLTARCIEAVPPHVYQGRDEVGAHHGLPFERASWAVETLIEHCRFQVRDARRANVAAGGLEDRVTELEDQKGKSDHLHARQADEIARLNTKVGELTRSAEASLAGRRVAEAKVAGLQAAIIDLEVQLEAARAALRGRDQGDIDRAERA